MKTTTYKCDKCGAEDTTNKIDIERVGVFVGNCERDFSCFHRETEIKLTQEWCRNCRIRYGLIPVPKEAKIEVTPITLEDIIREMMHKEIQAAH